MKDAEFLLTDEFVVFSQKVAEIHAIKKSKHELFKKAYDDFRNEISELDEKAELLLADWEEWKATQTGIAKET